jgi:hypothetical protein
MNIKALLSRFVRREPAANLNILETRDPAIITLISIIFSTASQTFDGPATLLTLASPLATSRPTSLASGSGLNLAHTLLTSSSAKSTASRSSNSSTISTTSSTPTTTLPPSVAPIMTNTPTATPVPSGMSAGGKVGLAFGIILLLLLAIAGAIALYRKRRSHEDSYQHRLDDEKNFLAGGRNPNALPTHTTPAFPGTMAATTAAETANARPVSFEARRPETLSLSIRQSVDSVPQLSLRAVSSFDPGLPNDGHQAPAPVMPANATSNIAAASVAGAAGAGAMARAVANQSVSPPSSSHANDPNNPFGSHAEKLSTSPPHDIALPVSPISERGSINTPRIEAADFPLPESSPATPAPPKSDNGTVAVAAGATAGGGAAAIMAATAAAASNRPQGASTPGTPGADTVHRVQLDFKPSMEDELGIHAGQLVRVIHEYDDGWVSLGYHN